MCIRDSCSPPGRGQGHVLIFWHISVSISKTMQDRYTCTYNRRLIGNRNGLSNGSNGSDLEWPWRSFTAFRLFKCNPSNICAEFYTISTDSVLARFLCISRASCVFGVCLLLYMGLIAWIKLYWLIGWFYVADYVCGGCWAILHAALAIFHDYDIVVALV